MSAFDNALRKARGEKTKTKTKTASSGLSAWGKKAGMKKRGVTPKQKVKDKCDDATKRYNMVLTPTTVTLYRALNRDDIDRINHNLGIRKLCATTRNCDRTMDPSYHVGFASGENVKNITPWLSFTHDLKVAIANTACNGTGQIGKFQFRCSDLQRYRLDNGQQGVFIHRKANERTGGNELRRWVHLNCKENPTEQEKNELIRLNKLSNGDLMTQLNALPLCLEQHRLPGGPENNKNNNFGNASREVVIFLGDRDLNGLFGYNPYKGKYTLNDLAPGPRDRNAAEGEFQREAIAGTTRIRSDKATYVLFEKAGEICHKTFRMGYTGA